MRQQAISRVVIVADDSVGTRDNVRTALGERWRVLMAANGAEAVAYARGIPADLILLDYLMPPGIDGIETCAMIRNLPRNTGVPIVLLTAYDSPEIRRRAHHAGTTAVFSKPFTMADLRAGVAPLVAAARQAAAQARGLTGKPEAESALDPREDDGLSVGRLLLAVIRKVDAAAEPPRYNSLAAAVAARREQSR